MGPKAVSGSGRRKTKNTKYKIRMHDNTKVQKYAAVQGRYLGPNAVSGCGRRNTKNTKYKIRMHNNTEIQKTKIHYSAGKIS